MPRGRVTKKKDVKAEETMPEPEAAGTSNRKDQPSTSEVPKPTLLGLAHQLDDELKTESVVELKQDQTLLASLIGQLQQLQLVVEDKNESVGPKKKGKGPKENNVPKETTRKVSTKNNVQNKENSKKGPEVTQKANVTLNTTRRRPALSEKIGENNTPSRGTQRAQSKSTSMQVEDKGCGCKGNCASKNCGCVKRGISCKDAKCKCTSDGCKNRESVVEDRPEAGVEDQGINRVVENLKNENHRSVFSPDLEDNVFQEDEDQNRCEISSLGFRSSVKLSYETSEEEEEGRRAESGSDGSSSGKEGGDVRTPGGSTEVDSDFDPMKPSKELSRSPVQNSTSKNHTMFLDITEVPLKLPLNEVDDSEDQEKFPVPEGFEEPVIDLDKMKEFMVQCSKCSRSFLKNRIQKHEAACLSKRKKR